MLPSVHKRIEQVGMPDSGALVSPVCIWTIRPIGDEDGNEEGGSEAELDVDSPKGKKKQRKRRRPGSAGGGRPGTSR